MDEFMERLTGVWFTIISGCFLVASLLLSVFKITPVIDPAWVSVAISGIPLVYWAIWKLIKNPGISKISSALLISIAMAASIAIGDLFAAGEIAFIMAIGEILESKTTARAQRGLKNLLKLTPTTGRRVTGDSEEVIPADNICIGDILRVLPGETIPVDGQIIAGDTSIDQAVITGESLPVDKAPGDRVFCGTVNRFGAFDMEATSVGQDTSLQRLIRMIAQAEEKQAPIQRIADRWASYLVPVALLLSVIAGLLRQDIRVAVTILVVFCPCALVLATPTAIMAAIGQATRHGVIIKSGEALEKMGQIDTFAMDKTGTLTQGNLVIADIIPLSSDYNKENLLRLTAAVECYSTHPIGKAITANTTNLPPVDQFRMTAGRGVTGIVENHKILCGNPQFLKENDILLPDIQQWQNQGKAIVLTAVDGVCIGILTLSDELRESVPDTIYQLHQLGTETVLLTGDNQQAASYFARQAGIDKVYAQLLPEDKVSAISQLQENHRVCMIGDGINDAPALKTANVGIAMGAIGSDIAVEAADIALISDDISRLPYLKKLANATVRTIRIAITLSLFINFAAIILSFFQLLNPTTGALVHNAGSCIVILFAALLYDRKFT